MSEAKSPSVSVYIFPLLSSIFLLLTCTASVLLTYTWQRQWHTLGHLPLISDAQNDVEQSPIFTTMLTITAITIFCSLSLVYLIYRHRHTKQNVSNLEHLPSTSTENSSTFRALLGRSRNIFQYAHIAFACSTLSVIFLLLSTAAHRNFLPHFVFQIATCTFLILSNLTLFIPLLPPTDATPLDRITPYVQTIFTAIQTVLSVLLLLDHHNAPHSVTPILQYANIILYAHILLLVSYRCRGVTVHLVVRQRQ